MDSAVALVPSVAPAGLRAVQVEDSTAVAADPTAVVAGMEAADIGNLNDSGC